MHPRLPFFTVYDPICGRWSRSHMLPRFHCFMTSKKRLLFASWPDCGMLIHSACSTYEEYRSNAIKIIVALRQFGVQAKVVAKQKMVDHSPASF